LSLARAARKTAGNSRTTGLERHTIINMIQIFGDVAESVSSEGATPCARMSKRDLHAFWKIIAD
jgi:hypothetical protein